MLAHIGALEVLGKEVVGARVAGEAVLDDFEQKPSHLADDCKDVEGEQWKAAFRGGSKRDELEQGHEQQSKADGVAAQKALVVVVHEVDIHISPERSSIAIESASVCWDREGLLIKRATMSIDWRNLRHFCLGLRVNACFAVTTCRFSQNSRSVTLVFLQFSVTLKQFPAPEKRSYDTQVQHCCLIRKRQRECGRGWELCEEALDEMSGWSVVTERSFKHIGKVKRVKQFWTVAETYDKDTICPVAEICSRSQSRQYLSQNACVFPAHSSGGDVIIFKAAN